MSTTAQLSENSHQGFDGLKAALCLASMEAKSNTASGMPLRLRRNGIGSRSSSKERDAETGLDYFGARYLSSAQGRWTSPDSGTITSRHLANPQKWNKYAYVINNPLANFDPDGREDVSVYIYKPEELSKRGTPGFDEGNGRLAKQAAIATAVGTAAFFAPELLAAGRGILATLLGYSLTPQGQQAITNVIEGLAPGPPGTLSITSASRLTLQEISTGSRLAEQTGLSLIQSEHIGAEFVDAAGKTYDAMGGGKAFDYFGNGGKFFESIVSHVNKSVDNVVIDLQGASKTQIKEIKAFVGTLTQEQIEKIMYVQ
jgi:RHS repeat-associated protein